MIKIPTLILGQNSYAIMATTIFYQDFYTEKVQDRIIFIPSLCAEEAKLIILTEDNVSLEWQKELEKIAGDGANTHKKFIFLGPFELTPSPGDEFWKSLGDVYFVPTISGEGVEIFQVVQETLQ